MNLGVVSFKFILPCDENNNNKLKSLLRKIKAKGENWYKATESILLENKNKDKEKIEY